MIMGLWNFTILIKIRYLEAPEEEYDSRSLYDRLQEQKNKKDMEYEEAHKLSMDSQLIWFV